MQDEDKTKERLITELHELRGRLAELENGKRVSINATELRRRAEKRVSEKQTKTDQPRTSEDTEGLLHELEVHQIELEMQNEELRNALEQLEESRTKYSDLYDFAPVGYVTLDENGLVLQANLTIARQLHIERSYLINHPFLAYIVPADRNVFRSHLNEVAASKQRQSCQIELIAKSVVVFHANIDSVFVQDSSGKKLYRTTVTDVTEHKQMQQERLQLQQRLHQVQKTESLGRMAGAIAHHLNNHLTVVMGNLEMALDDLPQESEARANIFESMKASRQSAEISRLMLAYLGQTKGSKEPLDLAEAIIETIPLLGASMPQKVHLKTELPARGPIILADAVHIKQVITNLITNAVEAIKESEGEITLTVSIVNKGEMNGLRFHPFNWRPKATRYACLSVADTGCGMDVATQMRIFDPFFSTKFTGRGLGLPAVLGLVRTYEGAIAFESRPGRGATFRVFFPLHTEQAMPSLEEEPPASVPLKGRGLVLVVDDEPGVRNMAQTMLKRTLGYEVLTADDGYKALEIFRARKDEISLVLLDLSMPGINGWETLSALRALRPDIPVVLASGYDEAQVMQSDHPDRPQAFIHKPYLRKDLQAAIDTALKKRVSMR